MTARTVLGHAAAALAAAVVATAWPAAGADVPAKIPPANPGPSGIPATVPDPPPSTWCTNVVALLDVQGDPGLAPIVEECYPTREQMLAVRVRVERALGAQRARRAAEAAYRRGYATGRGER